MAISLDPKDALAYSNRAMISFMQKDYARAEADLDEALRLGKSDYQFFLSRSKFYCTQGKFDRAAA